MALNSDKEVRAWAHHAEVDENDKPIEHQYRLDKNGLPLVPQPSDHKHDPLNWPKWYKFYVLFLICLLAFCVQFGAGMVPAAFNTIAEELHITDRQASYLTTTYTLLGGLMPLLITPYVNLWGRRPAYLLFTLIAIGSNIGSGRAASYGGEVVSRAFVGIGSSVAISIGAASICDMFFQGERGTYLGIYALALTNGPHFGPIAGGYIALNIGWRWIFFVNAIIFGGVLLLFLFSFPETLYSREKFSNLEEKSYWDRFAFSGKVLDRKLRLKDFANNFIMLKYAAVVIPCFYYCTANTYGSIVFVLTASHITKDLYKFDVAQNGLLLGIPLTLGCLIGECCTGWVSDQLLNRYAKRNDGYRKPEVRLHLAFLALFLPAGLIIHGVCAANKTPWIGLAVGMTVCSIGTQAATTLTYAYTTDCYKPQAAEVTAVINLFRQIFAFTIGFYALPFGEKHGFGVSEGVFAAINSGALLPLFFLMWKGEEIRIRQGTPRIHTDI